VPMLGMTTLDLMRFDFFQRIEQKLHIAQAGLRGVTWSLLTVIVIASLLVSGRSLDAGKQGNIFAPAYFPVGAMNWLADHPQPGNLFNEFTWGGYILFRLWPEQKVFIDGQTDFYGVELVKDYLTALNARDNWEAVLGKYNIDWVLLPGDVPLVKMLKSNLEWRILYEDDVSVILRK
jgi:hypothetical protein